MSSWLSNLATSIRQPSLLFTIGKQKTGIIIVEVLISEVVRIWSGQSTFSAFDASLTKNIF